MKKTLNASLALLMVFSMGWVVRPHATAEQTAKRPAQWATPLERPGLPNLFKVSDTLYRGAQPENEGYAELKKMGIKTIVNLRNTNTDRAQAKKYGIEYVHIPVDTSAPDKDEFEKFLRIAADPSRQPVFVHCRHGADRTGTAVALYRIKIQKWDREEAIREMTGGGYGYHSIFGNLKSFIRKYP
jgi:uncharacterized protein (TIGR01244 family)